MTAPKGLLMDIRNVTPAARRPLVLSVIDAMLAIDCRDDLLVISDHDLAALGYELDLRRESRGAFEYDAERRRDGSWLAVIRRRIT